MSTKSLLKFVVAFGLLALVLIFLGVNYVPRISASSLDNGNIVGAAIQTRPNYIDERYPRAIAPQLSFAGSDYFQRHSLAVVQPSSFALSDYFQRHPLAVVKPLIDLSDYFQRHPSNYFSNSDYFERHP